MYISRLRTLNVPTIFPEYLEPMTTTDTRVAVRPLADPDDSPAVSSSDSGRSWHHGTPEMNGYRRRSAFQSFSIESLIGGGGGGKDAVSESTAVRSSPPSAFHAGTAAADVPQVVQHRQLSTLFTNMLDTAIIQRQTPTALQTRPAQLANFDYLKILQLQSAAAAVGRIFSPRSLWPYSLDVAAFPPQLSPCYDNAQPLRSAHNRLSPPPPPPPPPQSFGCADEADSDSVDKSAGGLSSRQAEDGNDNDDDDENDDDDDNVDDDDAPTDHLHPLFGECYNNFWRWSKIVSHTG